LVSLLGLSFASNWYVSPTGNDDNSGTMNDPFQTLTGALVHVVDGDTIVMMPGTYSGIDNTDLEIESNVTISSQNGVDTVTIDVSDVGGDIFTVSTGVSLTLVELTIMNADSVADVYGDLVADSCFFSMNQYAFIFYYGSYGYFESCTITMNTVGIELEDGAYLYLSNGYLSRNTVALDCFLSTVEAYGTLWDSNYGPYGPAITSNDCIYYFESVTVENTVTTSDYGALYFYDDIFTAKSSTFYNNTGAMNGGAFDCTSGGSLNFLDCDFIGNNAVNGAAGDCDKTCTMTCQDCYLSDNDSSSGDEGGCNFQ